MERRRNRRLSRRLTTAFWERASNARQAGFTTNISRDGLFIATSRPLPGGTRIRGEIGPEGQGFLFEGVVAHAFRASATFQGIRQPGMGVRLLSTEELVRELIPELGKTKTEAYSAPVKALEDRVYQVFFEDRWKLLDLYSRDLEHEGIFVPTEDLAPLGSEVAVELVVSESKEASLRLTVRVMQRFEPGAATGGSERNLMVGLAVTPIDPLGSLREIRSLLDRLEA